MKTRAADIAAKARLVNPVSLGADVNDWNPAPGRLPAVVRVTASLAVNVTGLRAPDLTDPASLLPVYLHNMGASNVTLKNASASSAAVNRFELLGDVVLTPSRACVLQYDPVSSRWRVVGDQTPAYGSAAGTVTQGNDSRLTDARTPTAHATSHKSGGSDAIKLDELAAPTDITTLNASTSAHGLTPKGSGNTYDFLRGDLAWAKTGGVASRTVILNGTTTYTTPAGVSSIEVEVVGAGSNGVTTNAAANGGAGGASGGTARKFIAGPAASYTVAVGAGGTSPGNSTFGSPAVATGNAGGATGAANAVDGPAGGTASGGDVNITGQTGLAGTTTAGVPSGAGGSTRWGLGGASKSATGTGNAGTGYGSGGGGGRATAGTGGAGQNGIIVVDENK